MKKINLLVVLLWAVITLLTPEAGNAQARGNIDVALVIDSSGSMKKTDPKSLRIPAAKLFISLLDSNDRAAVLTFSDQGYPIAGLTPVNNDTNKKKLLNATDKITSKGLHTNLYGAFNKGMEVLLEAKEDGREQIIVLMSDGMMDVGDPDKDRQLLTKLKLELSDELQKNNIKVYSIAFTNQSDRRLLEKLSKQTGGFYNLALTDKDFHLVFTSIFESLKSPEMLPMEKNSFLIDGSIQEVTIVASKASPETDIQIIAPDGQTYSGSHQYSGISWFVSDNFDMITVQKPVQGRWEILYSTEENNKAYIITDLKLETNFEQLYAVFGENLDIKAWLEKEGSIIRDGAVLATTDISIELNNPDGNTSNLKPLNSGDGIFQKRITPFKDGNYKLRVIAKGKTYEREKAFLFNVANLQESKEDLKAAREARKADQAEIQGQAEEEEQEPVNWAKIIIQFISINLIIGILVIAYMKRQSIKDFKLVAKLFKRSKDTKVAQVKKKGSAESDIDTADKIEKPVEKEADDTVQAGKKQVALEDSESEGKEDEADKEEEVKERVALEEAASEDDEVEETGNDGALNNIEEEIQRLEKLKQEDGETQATGVSENAESEKEVVADTEEQKTGEPSPPEEVKELPEPKAEVQEDVETNAEETTQVEAKAEEDSVDDMWADAMNEQAAVESEEKPESNTESQKTDEPSPQEADKEKANPEIEAKQQVSSETVEEKEGSDNEKAEIVAEEHELDEETLSAKSNIADETQTEEPDASVLLSEKNTPDASEDGEGDTAEMWAAALDEQAKTEELIDNNTASASIDKAKENTGPVEGGREQDADQMWAEALSDREEASEESQLKNNTGGPSGVSD